MSRIGRWGRPDPERLNRLVCALEGEGFWVECHAGVYYLRGREVMATGRSATAPFDLAVARDLAATPAQKRWVAALTAGNFRITGTHRAKRAAFVDKLRLAGYHIAEDDGGLLVTGYGTGADLPSPAWPFDLGPALRLAGRSLKRQHWLARLVYCGLTVPWSGGPSRQEVRDSEVAEFVTALYAAGYCLGGGAGGWRLVGYRPVAVDPTQEQAIDLGPALEIASSPIRRALLGRMVDPTSGPAPTCSPSVGGFIDQLLDLGYTIEHGHITGRDPVSGRVRVLTRRLDPYAGGYHPNRVRALSESQLDALERLFDASGFRRFSEKPLRRTLALMEMIDKHQWDDAVVHALVVAIAKWPTARTDVEMALLEVATTRQALEVFVHLATTWTNTPTDLAIAARQVLNGGG